MALGGDTGEAARADRPGNGGGPEAAPPGGRDPTGSAPPPRRRGAGLRALVVLGGAVALVIAGVVSVLLTRPAQRAGELVQELLEPAPPRPRGVTEAEIVLGMVAPLEGVNRELGRGIRAGLEAAFHAVNEAGGVNGRRLRLVATDDGYDPSRTLPAMRQLLEGEDVFAIVGNVGTPTAAVAVPYASSRKVIVFGAFTGGDLLRASPPDRYVFNFRPSYAEEAAAAVRFLVRGRKIDPRRIAVLAQEDELGASGWRGAVEALSEQGVRAEEIPRFGYRRNTAEVTEAVAALRERAAQLDAVVMVATFRAAAAFVRRARQDGLPHVFTNVSAVDPGALADDLAAHGVSARGDVLVTQVVPLASSRSPAAVRYRDALERVAPGARPGPVSFEGFVVGSLLAEGLRRAGPTPDTEKLVAALHTMAEVDLGLGWPLGFSPTEHQASRRVLVVAVQPDGSLRQLALPRE